jgi:AbrB family looped-hinge helix DNA binding protein
MRIYSHVRVRAVNRPRKGTPSAEKLSLLSEIPIHSLQDAIYSYCKDMTTTISSKGQITVPVEVRKALGLVTGTKIELRLGPKGTFIAQKASGGSFFSKFQGVGKRTRVPYRDSREAMDVLRGPIEKGDLA